MHFLLARAAGSTRGAAYRVRVKVSVSVSVRVRIRVRVRVTQR
jgi:hypothetical protein